MKVCVLGSGAGAHATAAELGQLGMDPVMADLPEFAGNLEAARSQGGVRVLPGWGGPRTIPVRVVDDPGRAAEEADVVLVVVPCFGHEPFTSLLKDRLRGGQTVVFVGEGSGALVLWRELLARGRTDVRVGETNTLPYAGARMMSPGTVAAQQKGGVYAAGLPAGVTAHIVDVLRQIWPRVVAADSVWETVLLNYNAIDHVATMVTNVGTLEGRAGGMLLWGEGATPSVVRLIEAVDLELLRLRGALGVKNRRRYGDFLVEQGMAPPGGKDLYDTVRSSTLTRGFQPTGPRALETRLITEDVPYALVLASSLGDAVGLETPVIDGLIAIGSALMGRDYRSQGRTLSTLGLDGLDAVGLRRFAETGQRAAVEV